MQKRINKSIMLQTFISTLLLTILLSIVYYDLLGNQVKIAIKDKAEILKVVINEAVENREKVLTLLNTSDADFRFSLISSDGKVLYDSKANTVQLDNHANREEIIQALKTGQGQSKRFSNTFGMETYYVALQLNDGSILRLSKSSRSIFGVFANALPAMFAVFIAILLLSNLLSRRLTSSIIAPINNLDLDSDVIVIYDELSPFVRTIAHQRERISSQIADLENRAATLGAIMNSMREGLILLNHQGMILSANVSALSLFHVDVTVFGKNILELTRNVNILENVKLALAGDNREMFFSEAERSYQVFFSPAAENGAIVLFLNITDKAEAEKIRREFSANVTHELKTPLTSISGYAEIIHSGIAKQEDIQGFTGKIKDEAFRLILLIDNILMLSRLDEQSGNIEKQTVDLVIVAKEVADALSLKAIENDISLEVLGEVLLVQANSLMMYEMLYNLMDNAIKYNKSNGAVTVSFEKENDKAIIIVSDTGIGIPQEHQHRIFERFYRVDQSRSKKTGGTGLGLSIVKHIVQKHGGTIEMQSKNTGGTKMIITIPAAENLFVA